MRCPVRSDVSQQLQQRADPLTSGFLSCRHKQNPKGEQAPDAALTTDQGLSGLSSPIHTNDELYLCRAEDGAIVPFHRLFMLCSPRSLHSFIHVQELLIDTCVLAAEDSTHGQQAALLTGGLYLRPTDQASLLQYLLVRSFGQCLLQVDSGDHSPSAPLRSLCSSWTRRRVSS